MFIPLKSILKTIFHYFLFIVVTIVLAILMRVFLFDSFKIPSPSMKPAIIPGDTFYIENGIYKVKNFPGKLGCYENQLNVFINNLIFSK